MSNDNFINPLQVQLPTEEEDICAICQDNLSASQTYRLPECHHNFHTHCIVTWFRTRPSSEDDSWCNQLAQGGSCPCCGNKGINNNVCKKRGPRRWRSANCIPPSRSRYLRNYSKRNDAPKSLIKLFQKLDEAKENIKEVRKKKAKFMESLKTELVNFHDMDKKRREARMWIWQAQRKINALEFEIGTFPIIPIIIPAPIDIN